MSLTGINKKPVYTLNALRGFGAMFVVLNHIVYNGKFLDPAYLPDSFKYFYNDELLRVLIYFVISGTVIGLNNKQALTADAIPTYIKKRAIRIYPIYAISLIITLIISKTIYSAYTVAGNFTFLQILFTDVILENGPIWSLHYEILFYILFIPISMYNINPVKVVVGAVFIGLINYFLFPYTHSSLLTTYCFGFTFWATGLIIAKYFSIKVNGPVIHRNLISFLFLIICLPYLNKIKMLMLKFSTLILGHDMYFPYDGNVNTWFKTAITFYDFSYLPFCLMAVILFSQYEFKYRKIMWCLLQVLPAYTLYTLYKMAGHLDFTKHVFPIVCYTLSCLFLINAHFINTISRYFFQFFMRLGSISYGIYIIHMPLLVLFSQITFFSGSVYSFSIRMVVYLAVTAVIAYLLENQYQGLALKFLLNKQVTSVKQAIKANLSFKYTNK